MRRLSTGLVLAAIAGLGLAAAVDALRGNGAVAPEARPAAEPLDLPGYREAASGLRALGARGTITYSDEACRLHALRLPDLTPTRAPAITSCEPHIGGGGIGTWQGDVVWAGLGFGTSQVVLSSDDLTADVQRRRPWLGVSYRARQAFFLSRRDYAVILDSPQAPWNSLLVFYAGDRLRTIAAVQVGSDAFLRPSPGGTYVALVEPGLPPRVRIFSHRGEVVPLPSVGSPHTVAWSEDEASTALATRFSIYVFRSGSATGQVVRIPLAVRDLDWAA